MKSKKPIAWSLHFQYHSADRHSIAKLSASWDLFACSSPKIACWGPVTCRLKFVYISRKSGILKFCMGCFLLRSQLHEPRLPKESSISENTWPSGSRGLVFELVVWAHPHVNPFDSDMPRSQAKAAVNQCLVRFVGAKGSSAILSCETATN